MNCHSRFQENGVFLCRLIYSGGGPSTYVYCVVCYRVIAAPYVRNVGHVFAYLYTLDDDSEHPMDYETAEVIPYEFSKFSRYS